MTSATPPPSPESLSERLARLFGADVDPHISIAPVGESVSASEVVEELLRSGGVAERYEVRGEIDRGGMGVVLDVWDRELRRPLAMKVALGIQGELATGAPDRRRLLRFLEEAQITGQLDHPGIVPVHELGVDAQGRVFFTMRRVRGRDLREVLHSAYFGLDGWNQTRVLGVLLRVCETLAFAHSRGVLHRDIKPANVMVGAYGEVYVMDWGLARVIGRAQPSLAPTAGEHESVDTLLRDERRRAPDSPMVTGDGDVLGTPAYMPPEQARGERDELSVRGDVYSLGALLYHLLAREAPYYPADGRTSLVGALEALRRGPPRSLAELRPDLAPELVAITEKAMAYDPAERYGAMDELAHDLRAWLEGRVVRAHEQGALAEARKWVLRNRGLSAALVAGLLALIGGFATTGSQYLRAERRAIEAAENAAVAEAQTERVLRLSDIQRLAQLEDAAEALWPALPDRAPAMRTWLADADRLLDGLPAHRARLAALRDQALPYDAEMRRRNRDASPAQAELQAARAELESLAPGLEQLQGDALERLEQRFGELEERIAQLDASVDERRLFEFADVESQWQHDLLTELVLDLEALASPVAALGLRTDVQRRLEFAENIEQRSLASEGAASAWSAALAALGRDARFAGLDIAPQLGLLPLGPDPDSGLWEFAHLASGEPARRRSDGGLQLGEETGVVLVLLPPGLFVMGAQSLDPAAAHYDPLSNAEEGPPHEVALEAFLVSKYELTQAQWLRAAGNNPSVYGPHQFGRGWNREGLPATLLHPVEQVSWDDCAHILSRIDLSMPSEAQWEYAARAGSDSVWWTGDELASLQGAANLADAFGQAHGGVYPVSEAQLDDGQVCHAPVGGFRANAFGLHDTAGNVFEWCGDGFGSYTSLARAGDGARPELVARIHPRRGGAWSLAAIDARSAARNPGKADFLSDALGVRPARALR